MKNYEKKVEYYTAENVPESEIIRFCEEEGFYYNEITRLIVLDMIEHGDIVFGHVV